MRSNYYQDSQNILYRIHETIISTVILYEADNWPLNKKGKRKVVVFVKKILKKMCSTIE